MAEQKEADKEGSLDCCHWVSGTKKKNEWHKTHFRLFGGSLFQYKNTKVDGKPFSVFHLKDWKIEESPSVSDRKFSFGLRGTAPYCGELYFILSGSQEDVAAWLQVLQQSRSKEPYLVPAKDMNLMTKAKKNIAGRVSTSTFGRGIINRILDKGMRRALKAVKRMITLEYNRSVADRTERNVLKISVKTYFIWEKGLVTLKDLEPLELLSRKVLRSLYVVHVNLHKVKEDQLREQILQEKVAEISKNMQTLSEILSKLLEPHLTPKSIQRIKDVNEVVGSSDFLAKTYRNQNLKDDVEIAMNVSKNVLGWEVAQCDNISLLFDSRKW